MSDTPQLKEPTRACGDCTLCCKLLGVLELKKPADKWCEHCAIGKGCNIYPTRPQTCQDFTCAWLDGDLPESFKPNQVHFVVWSNEDRQLNIHIDSSYADTRNSEAFKMLEKAAVSSNDRVVIFEGARRTLYTTPEFVDKLPEKIRNVATIREIII